MAMTDNHTNMIHSINIGGISYEVHDVNAIHTLADLASLGMNTEGIFSYQGIVASFNALPTSDVAVGYVYHVTADDSEYVWTGSEWEEFGQHIVVNHTHDVTVTGENEASAVTGSATVTGGNSTSSVSGSATVDNVPKVSASAKYAKVSTGNDTFVKSYSGATSKMAVTEVIPAGAATSVINSVTPQTGSVTGVSGSVTASKATAATALEGATVGSAVSVATGLKGGKPAAWSASVTDGVLSFSFSANELQETDNTSITPAAALSIPQYSFNDVTVPKAAESASTFVTGVTTGSADVATVGTAVTVATGALASNGAGASVMTGLGTATTASALISANLATGTEADGIHTGDGVTVETQTLTGSIAGTAAAQVWTQNTGSISGTAAAQKWTQVSGVTSAPKE